MLFQTDSKPARAHRALWLILLPIILIILAFFLTLPLSWRDQAILGCLSHRVRDVCQSPAVKSVDNDLSVAYRLLLHRQVRLLSLLGNRSGTSRHRGRRLQPLTRFFVLLLLAAETYSFVILFLGCFQTVRPLKRASGSAARRSKHLAHRGRVYPDVQRTAGCRNAHCSGRTYDGLPEGQVPRFTSSMTVGDRSSKSLPPNAARPM